jgi:hypothetical protein
LADTAQLDNLKPADTAGFAGFLIDAVNPGLNLGLPGPFDKIGRVERLSDFFGVDTQDLAQKLLVQHSIPTTGGASGSPIFNANGNVIAIHSANNYQFIAGSSERIVSGAQVHYAQRVDLVRELLDGTASRNQQERAKLWKLILEQNTDAVQFYQLLADWKSAALSLHAADLTQLVNVSGKLSTAWPDDSDQRSSNHKSMVDFAVSGGGMLFVAAFSSPASPTLNMAVYSNGRQLGDSTPGYHRSQQLEFEAPQQFHVVLTSNTEADYCLVALSAMLTPQQKREALVANWLKTARSQTGENPQRSPDADHEPVAATALAPFLFSSIHAKIADQSGQFFVAKRLTVSSENSPASVAFLAIANTPQGESIKLTVDLPGQNSPSVSNNLTSPVTISSANSSAWANCRFTARDGDTVTLTVYGPNADIPVDIFVYALRPVSSPLK